MARIVVCLSALLFMVKAGTVPSATIYDNAIYDEGSKAYYRFHKEPVTWLAAYTTCVEEGGQLAVVTDENKPFFMSHYPSYASRVYLGFDMWETGLWRTIHGQSLKDAGYNVWNTGEPDNLGGNQRCGVIYPFGEFGDCDCFNKYPFICQMNAFPQGYKYYEGTKTYYRFHVKLATWLGAYTTCVEEGGHLAVINSQEEANYFVRNFPSNVDSVFLGFNNWEEGSWVTIHGKPLSEAGFEKWAPGEPNNDHQNQRCGAMYRSGELDDNFCHARLPFICEKNENPAEINRNEGTEGETTEGSGTTGEEMAPSKDDWNRSDPTEGETTEGSGTTGEEMAPSKDDWNRSGPTEGETTEGSGTTGEEMAPSKDDWNRSDPTEGETTEGSGTTGEEMAPSKDDWNRWGPTEGETTEGPGTTGEEMAPSKDDWNRSGPTEGETTEGSGTTGEEMAPSKDDWNRSGPTDGETTEGSGTTGEEMAPSKDDWNRWGPTEGETTDANESTRCEDSFHYAKVCKRVVSNNQCHRKLYSEMCCKSCSKAARGI